MSQREWNAKKEKKINFVSTQSHMFHHTGLDKKFGTFFFSLEEEKSHMSWRKDTYVI